MSRSLGPHKFLDVQNLVTSQQTYFYISQHRLQCFHSCDMIHTKRILFIPAKLVLDGNMFGTGISFPNNAKTPSQRDFHVMMPHIHNYHQGKSSQQCFQSLSNCFGDLSPLWSTVHMWYKNFSSAELRLKTVAIAAYLWLLLLNKTWPRWSVWSKKTHEWQ